ncbi:hypothetical protein BC332_31744 [Capsicum chinense]|nr:hypothetical protein BC332_31744 [Capsicum chinense]
MCHYCGATLEIDNCHLSYLRDALKAQRVTSSIKTHLDNSLDRVMSRITSLEFKCDSIVELILGLNKSRDGRGVGIANFKRVDEMQQKNVSILEDEVKFEISSQICAKLQSGEIDLSTPPENIDDFLSRKKSSAKFCKACLARQIVLNTLLILMIGSNQTPVGEKIQIIPKSYVRCNKKNSMAVYVQGIYIEFTLDVFGLTTELSTKSSGRVLLLGRPAKAIYANLIMILADKTLCREFEWGELSFDETLSSLKSSLKPTKTTVGASYHLVGFSYAFMKGAVEAFSLEHELSSNNDSEDKRFNVLNEKLDKLQRICSKKFKKIIDKNKILKFELSEIKILLLGKVKPDGVIESDKQMDNLQDEPSHDPMVHDQSDDPHKPTENERSEKKWTDKEGKNVEGHSVEKEEATEERVIGLRPLNMEDLRQ